MLTRWNFDGPHVWDKPGLSGYLVCLVHLVSLLQPKKQTDRTDQMNKTGGGLFQHPATRVLLCGVLQQ
jgi:hypothetical protein